MRNLPLLLSATLLAAPANADQFWLTDRSSAADAAAGSSPEVIEGVLLADEGGYYRVRVIGGEVFLRKSTVFAVEQDGLNVEAIVAAELANKTEGERANRERGAAQATSRSRSRKSRGERSGYRAGDEASVVDASLRRPAASPRSFDPVVGAVANSDQQQELMRAAERAYSLTKDRRYLKQLRRLRRLR